MQSSSQTTITFQVIFTLRVAEELAQDHDVVIIRPQVNPKATKIVSKHPRVSDLVFSKICEQMITLDQSTHVLSRVFISQNPVHLQNITTHFLLLFIVRAGVWVVYKNF